MANKKISDLTAASTPLAGTEVLPIVQSGSTVKVANNDLRPKQIQSNATSGVLQVAGPAAAATRVMTTPDADFTVARTDAAQSFTGNQTFNNTVIGTSGNQIQGFSSYRASGSSASSPGDAAMYFNSATGFTFQARAGSSYDWSLIDVGNNNYVLRMPTGTQNLEMAKGNLAFSTAAKGINFTANTGAAGKTSQLLNWYEEGTWTGTLGGQTTDPTTPVTATGLYTRIGRQVTVQIYFVNVNTTGGSGNMEIRGLPFTVKGTSNDHYIGSCESYGLDVPNKYNVAVAYGGNTKIAFQSMADDAAWTEPQLTAGTTKFLAVTVTYFV